MITKLTPKQEAALAEYRERGLALGLNTDQSPVKKQKEAVNLAYQKAGLNRPDLYIFLESPIAGAIGAFLLSQVESQVEIWDQVRNQVWSQVESQVDSQVDSQVENQVRDQVRNQIDSQVDSQVESQVESQVRSRADSQVRSQVWSQVRSQVWSQVWRQVDSQVRSQVENQVMSQVWSQVWSQVDSQVRSQVENQVRSQAWSQAWSQVDSQVWSQVRSQVWSQAWSQVRSQVRSQVWSQVRSQVWSQAWSQAWSQVRSQVWSQVWDQVENQVRDLVDSQVRSQVGNLVENQVWDQVDSQVRDLVENQVRSQAWSQAWSQVDSQVWKCAYGSMDQSWLSYYRFFFLECNLKCCEALAGLWATGEHCGWWWPFKGACIITPKPNVLNRDPEHNLHCENGLAIGYPDGWGVWAIHGCRVTEQIVMQPHTLTPEQIEQEENAEVRRIMIERFGQERFLKEGGAKQIAKDDWGTVFRKELPDDAPLVMVKVTNSTAEPDGSFKDYFLRIDPNAYDGEVLKSGLAAVASTWRDEKGEMIFERPEHYNPAMQT